MTKTTIKDIAKLIGADKIVLRHYKTTDHYVVYYNGVGSFFCFADHMQAILDNPDKYKGVFY